MSTTAVEGRSPSFTLFGEPVALPALVEVAISTLLAFHVLGQDRAGAILAVAQAGFGLYQGWATKERALAAFVALSKAAVTLVTVFGFTLDDQKTGAILGVATLLFTVLHRSNASPITGSPSGPPAPTPVVVTNVPSVPSDPTVGTTSDSGSGTEMQNASNDGSAAPSDGGDGGF